MGHKSAELPSIYMKSWVIDSDLKLLSPDKGIYLQHTKIMVILELKKALTS
jgi:hypothetical protein